jgi:RHS repeat-associated protein
MAEFPAQLFRMEGDPAAVRGSATAWSGFGATAMSTGGRIGSLDTSQFVGTEGDQFRSILAAMPPPLGVTADAFGQVATALTTFAGTLAGLQDEMRQLAAQAVGLWQELQAAIIRAATADPASKPAALAALRAAQARWDACEAKATALQSAQAAAVQTAADAVDRAAGMRFVESPGRWDRVGRARSFIQEHKEGLQMLSGGLKAVSLVAGLLSFTPLAPIAAPISVGAGLLAAGIDLSVYGATGDGNLTDIAIDVGLTALPGVGRLARPLIGALAGAGRPLLANAYRAGSGIRAAVAAKIPQLFTRVQRALAFDPIDLASGEMVFSQTDVELPGLLPLVLRRTHLSSYRVGRWFGRSWASTVDQRLEVDAEGVCFAAADGLLLVYPPPADGSSVLPQDGPRLALARAGDGYTVTDGERGHTLHFGPVRAGRRSIYEMTYAEPGTTTLPLTAITDRNGHRIDVVRDADGAPTEVVHSGGYRVAVETERGRVTALRLRGTGGEPDRELVRYGYDDRGDLVETIDSSGLPLRYAYDSVGRIVRWDDRNGGWYSYTYDVAGRVVRTAGSDGFLSGSIHYDPRAGVTIAIDSLGAPTTYQFTSAMQIERIVDPLGHTRTFEWDRWGRPAAETDALGRTTRYDRDETGNLVRVIRPDGTECTVDYNRLGLPVRTVGPDGAVELRGYDEAGNLLSVTDPSGATTRYDYAPGGRLRSVTDALGRVRQVRTDPAGLPVELTDPVGNVTTYRRDGFGRVVEVTDPLGHRTRLGWTVDGRLASHELPDGGIERWTYDGEGNLVEHVDAGGRTTREESTHFDLPAARIGPDGARTEFGYDTELRLTTVTNPLGERWSYEYDAAGRLVRETDFDGRVLSYGYDPAGQLAERTNGAGETVRFVRDAVGAVVERHAGDAVTTFAYDPAGRLVRATNPDADVVVEWDAVGRVVAETCNGRTVRSSWDGLGRRTGRRTPSGVDSAWDYGADGRPAALHTVGHTLRFRYDPAGREVERRLDGTVALSQDWDPASRLLAQTLSVADAQPLQRRTFAYRSDGAVERIEDRLRGTRTFALDEAGRVTAVAGPGRSERYAYDRAGRPLGAGAVRYERDAQGRVVLRQQKRLSGKPRTWRYGWDADDRLVSVSTPDGQRWRYRYDPFGRRIAKQRLAADGTVAEQVDFSWDGILLAEEESAGRRTSWEWAPGTVHPVSQSSLGADPSQEEVDASFHAIVTDLVGTPTELVGPDGTVDWRPDPALWGGGDPADTGCPLRFPGQYADPESALHYNAQRHYDPDTGRYASPDPIGLAGGPDPHAYVPNPLTWLDPLGLAPCTPPARFTVGTDGAVVDHVGTRNAISIGRFPDYLHDAQATGSRTFDLGDAWKDMAARTDRFGGTGENSEVWIRNRQFLDKAVAQGSEIRLASDPYDLANANSFFLREVRHLESRGYSISPDGTRMLPPGGP